MSEDQSMSPPVCRGCGGLLTPLEQQAGILCGNCIGQRIPFTGSASAGVYQYAPSYRAYGEAASEPGPPDPDRPPWGVGGGVGVWLLSVAAILFIPVIAVFVWLFIELLRGVRVPLANRDELVAWISSPSLILVQVFSLILAHLFTIWVIWAVVTRFGRRPFFDNLGWRWKSLAPIEGDVLVDFILKGLFVIGIVVAMFVIEVLMARLLPQSRETEFDKLLKASVNVRIVVAVLAVFTAPLVEEGVYRGVLYSGLRKRLGLAASVVIVTLAFALVHFPQYWGAWAVLVSLMVLSFTLTIVRARTKSILPCFFIHTLFNTIGAVSILLRGS